ncbi:MAG: hypothetical protein OXR68_06755 [Alphaproteobacteria bacterium]|nr:hypothetical protein [Alphaproteobacteria bacterium]MDD9920304.1 hypothetical protein [Alphaproteobacteria bacterium]
MTKPYIIRPETETDKPRIATLLARTYMDQGVQAIELVGELRQQENYNTQLSLVADNSGEAVACAIFARVNIDNQTQNALVLASLGIDTREIDLDVQNFLSDAMTETKKQGHRFVFMRGDLQEFSDIGFVKSRDLGLDFGKSDTGDWLVRDLSPEAGDTDISGKVDLPSYLV